MEWITLRFAILIKDDKMKQRKRKNSEQRKKKEKKKSTPVKFLDIGLEVVVLKFLMSQVISSELKYISKQVYGLFMPMFHFIAPLVVQFGVLVTSLWFPDH